MRAILALIVAVALALCGLTSSSLLLPAYETAAQAQQAKAKPPIDSLTERAPAMLRSKSLQHA
jgi:hypothetical protein